MEFSIKLDARRWWSITTERATRARKARLLGYLGTVYIADDEKGICGHKLHSAVAADENILVFCLCAEFFIENCGGTGPSVIDYICGDLE